MTSVVDVIISCHEFSATEKIHRIFQERRIPVQTESESAKCKVKMERKQKALRIQYNIQQVRAETECRLSNLGTVI